MYFFLALTETLKLDGNQLITRVESAVCSLRDYALEEFVVDCPARLDTGAVIGVICAAPACCTACRQLDGSLL
jgi:hypothetical protein